MRVILAALLALLVTFEAWAQDLDPYVAEAEGVLQRLRGTMMAELKLVLEMPPAEAVALCRHLAPEIKEEIEEETGWQVRRVALRVRHPENRPNDEERGILLSFETRSAAGQSAQLLRTDRVVELQGRRYVLFMQAIPTFDTCLVCHGADLDPEIDRAVRELYPEDETTGYSVGDIRGAFALYKPLPKRGEPGVAILVAPPKPLLERLGYRPTKRGGAVGDAGAGAAAFERPCKRCHAPDDLAKHLFAPETSAAERDLCLFLETHGLTGEPAGCDIVAFLQDLALFLAEKGQ
jgi:hypothetical protein